MEHCTFLPQVFRRGNYENYTAYWHAICNEILNHVVGLSFHGKTIRLQHPENHKTIWHIITKNGNDSTGQRYIDNSRAEHVPWIYFLLSENCDPCDNFIVWKKRHKGSIRWCVYCPKERYLVVLEERGKIELILITAFNVTPQRDIELLKDYRNYIKYGI